jgi:hypothetical protein
MVCELQEKIWTIEATAEEQERKFVENEKNHLAMINIYENSQNIGERDEILLQLRLIHLNNNKNFDELKEIFGEEASEGISILNIDTDDEIDKPNKLSKAPQGAKADCRIRMTKTNNVYNPAILNHTPRSAKIFNKGGIFNDLVECLDIIAEEYRNKRGNNLIGEDTLISNLTCLKHDPVLKKQVIKILLYFVFDGTGKGYSKYKSDAIMTCQGDKIIFRKCDSIQNKKLYIESIYDKIVISFRDKGMPKVPNEYCKPWVYDEIKPDGSIKHKGSLHIRIR